MTGYDKLEKQKCEKSNILKVSCTKETIPNAGKQFLKIN